MLSITTNAGQVARQLDAQARQQLPFATARALTWTARDAQADVRQGMPGHFTLRNRFTQQEVRFTAATKTNLTAEIGSSSRTDYMQRQETGGIKTPRGRHIAVPVNARRGKTGIIRRANRPSALLEKPKHFIGQVGQTYGIWKRLGQRKLSLMYHLVKSAQVDDRYQLDNTVNHTVASRFYANFSNSLNKALDTAK
jgi:hypothetical protein